MTTKKPKEIKVGRGYADVDKELSKIIYVSLDWEGKSALDFFKTVPVAIVPLKMWRRMVKKKA